MKFSFHMLGAVAASLISSAVWAEAPAEPSVASSDSITSQLEAKQYVSYVPDAYAPNPLAFDGCCCLPYTNCGGAAHTDHCCVACCDGGYGGCGCSGCSGGCASACAADGCCSQSVDSCCDKSADACCGDGVEGCCGDSVCDCCPPLWTVKAGAAILNRARPDSVTLATPLGGATIIQSRDFDFGWAGGPDVSVARRITDAGSLELRYLGALDWNARNTYFSVGNINMGGNALFGIDTIAANYGSTLHSTELNWRHKRSERFTWLAGFRWIELEDDFNFNIDFVALPTVNFNWNSNNHLYGGQLGGEFQVWQRNRLSFDSIFKGGIYGNAADNDFSLLAGPVQVASGGRARGDVAFVGEFGVTGSYQITQRLSLRAGYQLLWIDGVALASDQVGASLQQLDLNVLDTSGNAFYHGVLTGLDYVW